MRVPIKTIATLIVLFVLSGVSFSQSPPQPAPTPAASPTPTAEQEVSEDDVIKVETNLVTSNALVLGRDRKFVPNLRREDFRIFENGVEQPIAFFAAVDRPFDVVLIIDNSRSTDLELRHIKEAASAFVNKMRPGDRAAVLALSDKPSQALLSDNHQLLNEAIYNIAPAGGTRLYDTVAYAVNQLLASSKGRKAILVLTDGVDTDSRTASYQSNLDDVISSGVQVFAVQFSTYTDMSKKAARFRRTAPEGTGFSYVDYQRADAYLHQLTDLTGSAVFPADNFRDLDAAIANITDELHNEYTIGFYPKAIAGNRGEVRRLEVRVSQPWLRVRARSSYSFGGATVAADQSRPAIAPLSQIESRAGSSGFVEDKRPQDSRWICKQPFPPGNFALVQEGYDSHCPPSTRRNDQTNSWLIRKPNAEEIICKGFLNQNGVDVAAAPIPIGFAVIGEAKSSVCSQSNDPAHAFNAWKIKRPTAEDTICKGFPVPKGFVVVNEKKQEACPATTRPANAWVIIPAYDIDNRKLKP